ncbi:amidophosphoribosyltransferase [Pasteurella atlantica]|uniref:Amidophosphoribosyltransferase n=2 Tax=Pasteurellaceae TaxID=712 RepID=A0ACC6HLK5_9PAST|nr:amidophosphoribosyltransferase [Pasteurella atlantica]MDP8035375.1 amidophosphoribosyltransferase [Pasteurella atlantica]MDP8037325.1 amidophosphoribosyltransferase [Pasteurella atlantica]MDP8047561.1 amidophosphoribosyltransferase [Pasteurella atlantica]MDP8049628.1 amidophosphoribosyltransferase [Pasteurella atlantica]
MCGVVGVVVAQNYVNQIIFDALTVLQHRGQDAAGIVTGDNGKFYMRKENGLVREVIRTRHMKKLTGNIGIGHVRYPTAGTNNVAEAQPFYVNAPYGIALAHNGNLTNTAQLIEEIHSNDLRHLNTYSDSEILLNVFAHELQRQGAKTPTAKDIFQAITQVHQRIRGGYAVVTLITGYGIVAFRDPYGIRPLVYGSRQTDKGTEYMVASESAALSICGFKLERDIQAGEAIFISTQGECFTQICVDHPQTTPCLFEYIYLSRPDSILDGVSVYHSRMAQGIKLAQKLQREWSHHDIDVIIPIPETSGTAAIEMARYLNLPCRFGFVKNHYIGRTFIMPNQAQRQQSVRRKLNPIRSEFEGKNVLLVDDSIVRGTTSKQIIKMAREMGAKKVYFASAAPAVRYPNVYGIDMPLATELIGYNRDDEAIGKQIGADGIIFQDLTDLKTLIMELNPKLTQFETSIFDGHYITNEKDNPNLQEILKE